MCKTQSAPHHGVVDGRAPDLEPAHITRVNFAGAGGGLGRCRPRGNNGRRGGQAYHVRGVFPAQGVIFLPGLPVGAQPCGKHHRRKDGDAGPGNQQGRQQMGVGGTPLASPSPHSYPWLRRKRRHSFANPYMVRAAAGSRASQMPPLSPVLGLSVAPG